jgi:hypothetical protein
LIPSHCSVRLQAEQPQVSTPTVQWKFVKVGHGSVLGDEIWELGLLKCLFLKCSGTTINCHSIEFWVEVWVFVMGFMAAFASNFQFSHSWLN